MIDSNWLQSTPASLRSFSVTSKRIFCLSSSNAAGAWILATLGGNMYPPWLISGLSLGAQAAKTVVNAPWSWGYIMVPRSHIQNLGNGKVFRERIAPSCKLTVIFVKNKQSVHPTYTENGAWMYEEKHYFGLLGCQPLFQIIRPKVNSKFGILCVQWIHGVCIKKWSTHCNVPMWGA